MLDLIFSGYDIYGGIKPIRGDAGGLSALMDAEMNEVYLEQPYTSTIPQYIGQLFHQSLNARNQIIINLHLLNVHFFYKDDHWGNCYGYKKFKKLFMSSDGNDTLKISTFIKLCPNLVSITMFNAPWSGYKPSINLDEHFLREISHCIELLTQRKNAIFTHFQIVNPIDSIQIFMEKNKTMFIETGWKLTKTTYDNPALSNHGESSNTLSINKCNDLQ